MRTNMIRDNSTKIADAVFAILNSSEMSNFLTEQEIEIVKNNTSAVIEYLEDKKLYAQAEAAELWTNRKSVEGKHAHGNRSIVISFAHYEKGCLDFIRAMSQIVYLISTGMVPAEVNGQCGGKYDS